MITASNYIRKLDIECVAEVMGEKYDNLLSFMTEDTYLYSGAISTYIAGQGLADFVCMITSSPFIMKEMAESIYWARCFVENVYDTGIIFRPRLRKANIMPRENKKDMILSSQISYKFSRYLNRDYNSNNLVDYNFNRNTINRGKRNIFVNTNGARVIVNHISLTDGTILDVLRKSTLTMDGIIVDRNGSVYEIIKSAEKHCQEKTIYKNHIDRYTNCDEVEAIINAFNSSGWKSRVNIGSIRKAVNIMLTNSNKLSIKKHSNYTEMDLLNDVMSSINDIGGRYKNSNLVVCIDYPKNVSEAMSLLSKNTYNKIKEEIINSCYLASDSCIGTEEFISEVSVRETYIKIWLLDGAPEKYLQKKGPNSVFLLDFVQALRYELRKYINRFIDNNVTELSKRFVNNNTSLIEKKSAEGKNPSNIKPSNIRTINISIDLNDVIQRARTAASDIVDITNISVLNSVIRKYVYDKVLLDVHRNGMSVSNYEHFKRTLYVFVSINNEELFVSIECLKYSNNSFIESVGYISNLKADCIGKLIKNKHKTVKQNQYPKPYPKHSGFISKDNHHAKYEYDRNHNKLIPKRSITFMKFSNDVFYSEEDFMLFINDARQHISHSIYQHVPRSFTLSTPTNSMSIITYLYRWLSNSGRNYQLIVSSSSIDGYLQISKSKSTPHDNINNQVSNNTVQTSNNTVLEPLEIVLEPLKPKKNLIPTQLLNKIPTQLLNKKLHPCKENQLSEYEHAHEIYSKYYHNDGRLNDGRTEERVRIRKFIDEQLETYTNESGSSDASVEVKPPSTPNAPLTFDLEFKSSDLIECIEKNKNDKPKTKKKPTKNKRV